MPTQKYLLIQRSVAGDRREAPSPQLSLLPAQSFWNAFTVVGIRRN